MPAAEREKATQRKRTFISRACNYRWAKGLAQLFRVDAADVILKRL